MSTARKRPPSAALTAAPRTAARRWFLWQAARYPDLYTWYVFVSSVDILFTWLILAAGGTEVNAVAAWIISRHKLPGLVVFKFLTVVLVVLICEVVGRHRHEVGAKLARWAVVISTFPIVVGAFHLLPIALRGIGHWRGM